MNFSEYATCLRRLRTRSRSGRVIVVEFRGGAIQSIKAAFGRLCAACAIKGSPHVLRHTAATWLVMDGVPLAEVARLLGDNEKTVERVYGKHAPDYLRRAVNALNIEK